MLCKNITAVVGVVTNNFRGRVVKVGILSHPPTNLQCPHSIILSQPVGQTGVNHSIIEIIKAGKNRYLKEHSQLRFVLCSQHFAKKSR
jgi:hypothetical protein